MELSDNQILTEHNDAEMMKRDHLWPMLTLPLKKRREEGGYDLGLLLNPVHAEGAPWTIYVGASLFNQGGGTPVEYPSAEAIVADGWIVD